MKPSSNAGQRELQWRERIRQQRQSGQSISAWCREQGIAVPTFYWWNSRLAKCQVKQAPTTPKLERTPFIDLGALQEAAPAAGMEIRLDLGNGMVLSIARR